MKLQTWLAISAIALLVPGCAGDNATPAESTDETISETTNDLRVTLNGARSGSRLKAEFLETDDGFQRFDQFHDTVLDSPCNFSPDENGEWRCIPEISAFFQYLDPGCTDAVLVESRDAATIPPYFNTGGEEEVCTDDRSGNRFTAWTRGEEVQATAVFLKFGDTCFPSSVRPGQVVRRVVHVDPSSLVKGEFGFRFAGGWRLVEEIIFGEDGSHSPLNLFTGSFLRSMFDWVLNTRVVFTQTEQRSDVNGKGLWVGAQGAQLPLFANDTCSTPAAFVTCGPQQDAVAISGGAVFDEASCKLSVNLVEVGETPVDDLFQLQGDICMAAEPPASLNEPIFGVGGPIDSRRFLSGRFERRGSGRISVLEVKNHDGSRVPLASYDEDLGAFCSFLDLFGDGANFFCLPSTVFDRGFTDPACTQAAVVLDVPGRLEAQSCFQGVRQAFTFSQSGPGTMIRTIAGAPISAEPVPVFEQFGTQCFPVGTGLAYTIASEQEIELARGTRRRR